MFCNSTAGEEKNRVNPCGIPCIARGCVMVGTDFCEKSGMMIGEYLPVACASISHTLDGHNDGHTHGAYQAYLYDCFNQSRPHALFIRRYGCD
jgi:hypothetical protein